MTNEEMVLLVQRGHIDLMETLYLRNRRFICKCVRPFRSVLYDMDDLMQTAYFGLLEAAKTFNPELGYKFLTHAKYYITGTVRREVNRFNGVPDYVCTLIKQYKHSFDKLTTLEGKSPSEGQILAHMGLSKIQLDTIKRCMAEPARLDKTLHSDTDLTLADTLPDDNLPNVDDNLQQQELKRLLWAEVDKLPEKLRAAIVNHYWLNAERNYLLENKALRRLRKNHKLMRRLKELLL